MREAAWPLIRRDLGLDYVAIGLLITVPNVVGSLVQPILGLLGDTGRRRAVVLTGGVVFMLSLLWHAWVGAGRWRVGDDDLEPGDSIRGGAAFQAEGGGVLLLWTQP